MIAASLLIIAALSCRDLAGQASEAGGVIGVCEILRSAADWNGKMVRIRGTLAPGGSESGPSIEGECRTHIVVAGRTFADDIVLQAPENSALLEHPANFRTDEDAIARMNLLFSRLRKQREHVTATVIGIFETRVPLEGLIKPNSPYPWHGFGHLGGSPAQIIVKTIVDMRIEPNNGDNQPDHRAAAPNEVR